MFRKSAIAALSVVTLLASPVSAETVTVAQGATLVGDGGGIEPQRPNAESIKSETEFYSPETTTPPSEWVWVGDTNTVDAANYVFVFDLTRYDLSSVNLSGLWGVDNTGQIFLNGERIAALPNVVVGNFDALKSYGTSDTSLFVDGPNELLFELVDDKRQAAFRATATVTAAAIPLPAGGALLLLGLAGLAAVRRTRAA